VYHQAEGASVAAAATGEAVGEAVSAAVGAVGVAVGAAVGAPVCSGSQFEIDPAGHSSSAAVVVEK
jgi:hypothetical protein